MSKKILTNKLIAKKYAKAIFSLAIERNIIDKISADLATLAALIKTSPKAKAIIENAHALEARQNNLIEAICKNTELTKESVNFLKLLIQKKRICHLGQIIKEFTNLWQEENNQINAKVISVTELDKKQMDEISDILSNKFAKKVICHNQIDEKILGGVAIKIGSKMIDCSLARKLKLFEISSKEKLLA